MHKITLGDTAPECPPWLRACRGLRIRNIPWTGKNGQKISINIRIRFAGLRTFDWQTHYKDTNKSGSRKTASLLVTRTWPNVANLREQQPALCSLCLWGGLKNDCSPLSIRIERHLQTHCPATSETNTRGVSVSTTAHIFGCLTALQKKTVNIFQK